MTPGIRGRQAGAGTECEDWSSGERVDTERQEAEEGEATRGKVWAGNGEAVGGSARADL